MEYRMLVELESDICPGTQPWRGCVPGQSIYKINLNFTFHLLHNNSIGSRRPKKPVDHGHSNAGLITLNHLASVKDRAIGNGV